MDAGDLTGRVAPKEERRGDASRDRASRASVSLVALGAAFCNACCPTCMVEVVAGHDAAGFALHRRPAKSWAFPARAYHRSSRWPAPLADLDGVEAVGRIIR